MTEIKSYLDPVLRKSIKAKKQVAVIPVGSIEQHGPHLPISTDSDIVTEVARRICQKNKFLLLPTLNYGVSHEHAPFFQLSLKKNTLQKVLIDLCLSLVENKINKIFIINGHHGNIDALKNFERRLQNSTKSKVKIFVFSYWHFMEREFDHAGFVETSLMLAISKEVKMNLARKGLITEGLDKTKVARLGKLASKSFPKVTKNGVWGDPTKSTRKDGNKFLLEIVDNLAKKCQTCLTGHR